MNCVGLRNLRHDFGVCVSLPLHKPNCGLPQGEDKARSSFLSTMPPGPHDSSLPATSLQSCHLPPAIFTSSCLVSQLPPLPFTASYGGVKMQAWSDFSPAEKASVASPLTSPHPSLQGSSWAGSRPLSSPVFYYSSRVAFCSWTCHVLSHICWASSRSRAADEQWVQVVYLGVDSKTHRIQSGEVRQRREGSTAGYRIVTSVGNWGLVPRGPLGDCRTHLRVDPPHEWRCWGVYLQIHFSGLEGFS